MDTSTFRVLSLEIDQNMDQELLTTTSSSVVRLSLLHKYIRLVHLPVSVVPRTGRGQWDTSSPPPDPAGGRSVHAVALLHQAI